MKEIKLYKISEMNFLKAIFPEASLHKISEPTAGTVKEIQTSPININKYLLKINP